MSNYYGVVRSPDYLEQHGILGMKWGVWNSETRARREGRPEKKELTPEEIELKKIKSAETRKKVWEGAKKVAAVTYDVAKIAMSIYLAKQMSTLMMGQIMNTSLQLSKIGATNELITNGGRILNDPSMQQNLTLTMNTIDKANQLASNPNLGATLQFLNDPNTLAAANNMSGAMTSLGNSTVTASNNMYSLGTNFTQADYDEAVRLANLYRY